MDIEVEDEIEVFQISTVSNGEVFYHENAYWIRVQGEPHCSLVQGVNLKTGESRTWKNDTHVVFPAEVTLNIRLRHY